MHRILFAFFLLLAACSAPPANDDAADRAALIALDQAYAETWSRNDADAVMALFADDAVIIPHDGDEAHVGQAAIRAFWFPDGGPPVVVRRFEHRVTDASVAGGRGVVWGRFSLAFEFDGSLYSYDGNFMLAGRQREDGRWEITHLTWNDPPPTVTLIAR